MTHYQNYSEHREIKWNDENIKIKMVDMAHWVANMSLLLFLKGYIKFCIVMCFIDNCKTQMGHLVITCLLVVTLDR